MNTTRQFTATQLARAIGKKRQAMQRLLSGVAPCSQIMINGNLASVWTLPALPASLQGELTTRAKALGYRDAGHMLQSPGESWKPTLPLSEVAPRCIDKAVKL